MKTMIPACLMVCLIALAGCGNSGNVARPAGTGAGTILTFSNVSSITNQNSKTTEELNNVTFANNLFVAVGAAGTIVTSPDGVNWTIQNSTTPLSLYGITYGPGPSGTNQFIAVGGNYVAGFGVILTGSADGTQWTVERASSGLGASLTGVTYANGQYVAVGNNQVMSSSDGINWNSLSAQPSGITAPTVDLFNTAYGNNLFVTAGTYNTSTSSQEIAYDGLIATSPDAVNWTILPFEPNYLSGITYGGGRFVAVGREGSILTSTTGTSWTPQSLPPQLNAGLTPYLISVIYAGGQYVVTGNYVGTNPSTGFLLTSADGITWTMQSTPAGVNVYGISYGVVNGVGTYVAVGGE